MMLDWYTLGTSVSKITQAARLWDNEKGLVEVGMDSLAVPIMLGDRQRGYVFQGVGKLIFDAIVETSEGAVGKPIEKDLKRPFLILGKAERVAIQFASAEREDLAKFGYASQEGFLKEAEDLLHRFFRHGKRHCHGHGHGRFDDDHGSIFGFEGENGALDTLVADGHKLVFTTKDVVFVSNKDNQILQTPCMTCLNNGHATILKNGRSFIVKK